MTKFCLLISDDIAIQRLGRHRFLVIMDIASGTMDIASGTVTFGRACPGKIMQTLQQSQPDNVAKIKKLQLSISRYCVSCLCNVPCKDLAIIRNFIISISALEELLVLNYESDWSELWPAVFRHAESLTSLVIHTPPHDLSSSIWTPEVLVNVAKDLPNLKHLEMDLPLGEAESLLSASPANLQMTDALVAKLNRLNSLLINVTILDIVSCFASMRTPEGREFNSFDDRVYAGCEAVARALFERFHAQSDGALRKLEVRCVYLARDEWSIPWIVGHTAKAEMNEAGNLVVESVEEGWRDYLPEEGEFKYKRALWNLEKELGGTVY